jgi:hypothetical protein
MTIDQEHHLRDIKYNFLNLIDAKYRAGAVEHKGDLMGMTAEQLIDEAINENIDQITYLLTLREKIKK